MVGNAIGMATYRDIARALRDLRDHLRRQLPLPKAPTAADDDFIPLPW